jgi:hypothetical protein
MQTVTGSEYKVYMEGDVTELFNFYETVQNEETGEDEEVTASMSWDLPREENSISLVAEGKDIGNGKLTVTHSTSGGNLWNGFKFGYRFQNGYRNMQQYTRKKCRNCKSGIGTSEFL